VTLIRSWVDGGGGFIGMNDPSACARQGHLFQLHDVLGVDRERGQGISAAKPPFEREQGHFILKDHPDGYLPEAALPGVYKAATTTKVLAHDEEDIHLAVNTYGRGRSVYLAEDLPFGPWQVRLLTRMLYWAAGCETDLETCFSNNPLVECAAFPETGHLVLMNNTGEPQRTSYRALGGGGEAELAGHEMRWVEC
jgi:1,3-beta-galactosyl-N-acetylhexosamine phosphorylase